VKTFIHKMKSRKWKSFVLAAFGLQSLYGFFFTLALLGTVCIANTPVRADSINNPLYDVTGTMTISGNPVCGYTRCSETINFSFLYGYNYFADVNEYYAYIVPSSINVTSFGALGSSFTYNGIIGNVQPVCSPPESPGTVQISDANYMSFLSGGTNISLDACGNVLAAPVVPSFPLTELYACGTAACVSDFVPANQNGNNLGIFLAGSVQTSVTAVPEGGSMLGYLLISLAPIGLAIRQRRGKGAKPRLCHFE
jgi:hypothetical protein